MVDFLPKMGSHETMTVLTMAVVGLTAVLLGVPAVLASHWRRLREARLETELKHELVARGMSAEEIERVVHAHRFEAESGVEVPEVPAAGEVVVQWEEDWYAAVVPRNDARGPRARSLPRTSRGR